MKYVFRMDVALLILCASLALAVPCHSSGQAFNQIAHEPNVLHTQEAMDRTEGGTSPGDADCFNPKMPSPAHYIRSDGLLNNKAIALPQPIYPEKAKARGVYGVVKVSIVVDENGKVIWARIKSGQSILREAVARVVCQARFTPPVNGNIKVRGDIIYRFVRSQRVPPNKSSEPTPN